MSRRRWVQARLNYREPGITEREPDALDNLIEREPKSPMIARPAADDCKPLHLAFPIWSYLSCYPARFMHGAGE
jgi:hypothetical protein